MKRLVFICLTLVLFLSCSTDNNDHPNFRLEVLPVESVVEIPDEFELGETYPITISYFKPSTCHSFSEFYYAKDNNERTVAPIDIVFDKDNCEALEDELVEQTFNFTVTSNGSYIFKFWQGEDEEGEDQFIIIEVPVVTSPSA
ncbi:hypothetical protein KFZ70_04470 [Tamlana fucoidanivorans]|uniref:GOLD domain-containing protein n=1 Tax=Allotamlana fucoidanivorans TaxID=2583814 RepID=A0A5C4SSI3_9FLAO|nr:hypothetical protein [Tamlana fucoidanivorans]TNJ47222.1 hypothetical protein FGF67_01505 [Tamlana fucoidanivorans]